MEQDIKIIVATDFQCAYRHTAKYVCATEGCTNSAFMCIDKQCPCNKSHHNSCKERVEVIDFTAYIERQKKVAPQNVKSLFEEIDKKFQELIIKLSEDRLQFIQNMEMFGLSQKMVSTVKLLNTDKTNQINGQRVNQIFEQVQPDVKPYLPKRMTNYHEIKDYQAQIQSMINQLIFQMNKPQDRTELALTNLGQLNLKEVTLIKQFRHWEYIPIQICMFKQLQELNLRTRLYKKGHNHIRKIQNLQQSKELKRLDLLNNQIAKIQNLEELSNLKYLNLNLNRLQKTEGAVEILRVLSKRGATLHGMPQQWYL